MSPKNSRRGSRIDRRERMTRPRRERHLRQIVGGRGEFLRVLELRHEGHAAGEVEAPRMVAAADLRRPAGTFTSMLPRCVQTFDRQRSVPPRRAREAAARREARAADRAARESRSRTATGSPIHCHVRANTRSRASAYAASSIEAGFERRCGGDVGVDGVLHVSGSGRRLRQDRERPLSHSRAPVYSVAPVNCVRR